MSKSDLFHDGTKSIPKGGDRRVHRIEFDKSDLGARKSHLRGADKKNSNTISHIKGG